MKAIARVRGVVGQIKWSYYNAAAVNGYTVSRDKDKQWSLRGTVVLSDPFKMKQRPLVFVAPHKEGEWRWPIRDIKVENGRVVASLGPPEEKGKVIV